MSLQSIFGKPTTPRVKKIFSLAKRSSEEMGHNYIGDAHLLRAILKEKDGVAARAILSLATAEQLEKALELAGGHKPVSG